MLDLFWQRILPYQMTRIQEPDLLIDHDSGGGGGSEGDLTCKRFLGRPLTMEPFVYSGISSQKQNSSSGVIGETQRSTSGPFGKWFHSSKSRSCVISQSPLSPPCVTTTTEPIVVVHNNNRLDILDENTRWSSSSLPESCSPSTKSRQNPSQIPPLPPIVIHPNQPQAKSGRIDCLKNVKKCKNSNVKNSNGSNKKNNAQNNSGSNSDSNNSSKSVSPALINNCGDPSTAGTTSSPCLSPSNSHHHHRRHPNRGDDEDARGHLLVRFIHCNERPNKRQLVTLGLISVLFLIVLVILLALFLGPSSSRTLSKIGLNDESVVGGSDPFISNGDINLDEEELEDSDSYEDGDGDMPLSSTTSSSPGLDLKKVSKLSWDLLNSNQDATNSRGRVGNSPGSSSSNGGGALPSNPLAGVSSTGEGEIILPARMIYTSSGDGSGDLVPATQGTGEGGPQNKKRSCCRTQKYSQVIKREGCEPLTIVNKMCFGQCVSVWVPGLFASFPVCRPSKSTFKTVTLTCGKNKERRKRVRIEKVRRCSCMEIEPTAASL